MLAAEVNRFLQLPAGMVARAQVAHLAALDQPVERAQRFFQPWRNGRGA
jgi:hypothetical protein